MIDNQDDGVISKKYNNYKEIKSTLKDSKLQEVINKYDDLTISMFPKKDNQNVDKNDKQQRDTNLAKSHVQDVVDKQALTAELLQDAKNGQLTYKEYLAKKRHILLSSFPNIDKYNDEQKQKIKQGIDTLDVDTTNRLQQQILALPNKDNAEYKTKAKEFFTEFLNVSTVTTEQKSKSAEISTSSSTTRLKKAYNPSDGDRLMTFEEVFKLEQGVEFNKENIQKYNESVNNFALAVKLNSAKETINKNISSALERYKVDSSTGLNSTDINNANLALTLKSAIAEIYGKDKIAEGLADLTDGKYTLDENTNSLEDLANKYHGSIKDIAKLIQAKITERCDKAMGGKSLEDYAKTMAEDYKNAYGYKDASTLANAFVQDQESIVQVAKNGIQIIGTLIMVAGMAFFPPLALVGGLIASFGGIGVEALNELSKQNASPEKMDELKKEFAQNVALYAVGAEAGKLGSSAKAMLTAKNAPKFVAMIGDIGVDSTVSLIGDLVLTGQLDITGEGFSQVMSLIAGHKGKIVKGVQHLKEKVNDKFRLQSENPNRNIMQMPNGTLVEVKPDGSTVEVKADEVRKNNYNSEQPTEWKKINIGGEEIEVAMTRDASGNTNVDFSRARKLNADGKYEEFKATTQGHLLADEATTNNQIFKSEEEFKKYIDNAQRNDKPRFSDSDKEELILAYKENPKLVSFAIQEIGNEVFSTAPRFNTSDIIDLVDCAKENPDLVLNLLKERSFNKFQNRYIPTFDCFKIDALVGERAKIKRRFNKNITNEITTKFINALLQKKIDSNGNSSLIFDNDDIDQLIRNFYSQPNETVDLMNMTKKNNNGENIPRFNIIEILNLSNTYKEYKNEVSELLNMTIKNNQGENIPRFRSDEIIQIAPKYKEKSEIIQYLLNTKTLDTNGNQISVYSNEIIKLVSSTNDNNMINAIIKYCKTEDLKKYNLSFIKDIISKNETNIIPIADNIAKNNNIVNYHINYDKAKFKDSFCITSEGNNTVKTITFDKNGNVLKSNSLKRVENNTKEKTQSTVFENYNDESGNNVSFISRHSNEVQSDKLPINIKNQYVKEVKSPDGKVLYKEYHIPSKDYPNKFDIYREENGRRFKIGSTETTNNGQYQNIERTIHSSDGTQTQYFYAENANGRMTNTIIKDKNGNVLLNNRQQFNKIDDNHYISKENGKTYDIQYFDDKVVVKNDNGETIEISIVENGENGFSKDLLPLLKQLPGSILFDIKKYNLSNISITYNTELTYNAAYRTLHNKSNDVVISPELSNKESLFDLIHELGHYKDDQTKIYSNEELLKIFNSERDELLKNSSEIEFNEMAYFLSLNHYNEDGAITEMIADTNALRFSSNKDDKIEARSMFMQEHFPKTFAKIVELLQQ